MHVVSLEGYRRRDIGVVLRHLLERHEVGQLKGLAVCAKTIGNVEEISFSGHYRDEPTQALSAAMKMKRRIAERIEDDED